MKRWFCIINIVVALLSLPTYLKGQILNPEIYSNDCIDYDNNTLIDTTYRNIYESRNGASHSPHGEIRFVVVFAELVYENQEDDPSPNGTEQWRPGNLPVWKDSLLSVFRPSGISDCHLTKYYQYASSNNHIVLGDCLLAPTNGGLFQIPTTDGYIKTKPDLIINAINQQIGDTITTACGLNSISYFDQWTTEVKGKKKINSGDNMWDFVVFIVRNATTPSNSTGYTSNTNSYLLGHKCNSYTTVCTNGNIPTQIIRHEYAHKLLGGNNFHTAGGGYSGSNHSGNGNYWIPQTSGWGLLGLYGCSLWCWNAWDRQRLGWVDSTSTYEISARNQNGIEVNGDLDATNLDDAGIYILRDFVTTGDAIRIKLPYINSDKEYQEWLWIENHQGVDNNNNEFDQWQYQDRECVEDFEPGLMMYMQINNDTRVSNDYKCIFEDEYNHADYTRVLTANGLWDRVFLSDSIYANCVNYKDKVRPFTRLYENPFTGSEDQSQSASDLDDDNKIEWNDFLKQWIEYDGTTYHKHLWQLGHSSHSFNLQGNRKIGIGTNPSTASLINMVGENKPYANAKNLRKTYLNGISVEMLEQLPNGDIKIRIRFDDVNVENDVRWCSDSIVLNPINNDSDYSLILKSGKTILLDQGLTATRMTNPMVFNDKKIFASPTVFTIMPDADIHLEPSSKIILENGSKMHFSENSSCTIENQGYLEIKCGTVFMLDNCSSLTINGDGKFIVRNGAELRISPDAVLSFQNGINNLIIESNVIIPEGYADPRILIEGLNITSDRTLNGVTLNLNGHLVIESNVTLNLKSSIVNFGGVNSGIIVKPGGRLVIDGGVLTSACPESKWQGIQVWGIVSLLQHLSNGKYLQGVLELKNGATIENAVCAVDLWNPLDEHSEGGIVWAKNATFRNNAKAIRALNYSNYTPNSGLESQNASWFRNCSFIIDSDYIGNNTFYNHVELNNVDGIKFYACSFSADNSASQLASSISAIYASSAGFTVTSECSSPGFPCPEDNLIYSNFNGFDNAIHVTNNGGSVRTFSVSGSEFWNNERGIYATNTGYATIINNKFYIGSKTLNNYGIYIENVMNFCIEENYFTATKKANSYGLVVVNSPSYNEIYLNHFYNLHYGNIAGGVNVSETDSNIGLAYICNTNEGNTNDFGVMQYNGQAYIKLYQGSSTIAAANTFSATNYHFYNEGNFLIKYFYNGGANRPTRVLRVSSVAAAKNHECESHYDVVVGGGGSSGGGMMSAEKTDSLKNKYENSFSSFNRLNSLNTYKIEKDSLQRIQQESQMSMLQRECLLTAGDIVRTNLNKEERDFNELREWIGKSNDISSARMIIASYIQQKDFVNAIALAKTLPAAYDLQGEELNEFYDYLDIIRLHESLNETNRTTLQLSDYEITLLEDIAENGTGASKAMADAILAENRGLPTIVISACPTIPNFATAVRGTDESEMTSDTAFNVELSPNPATTNVEVSYTFPENETNATLVMTNTLGVNVMTVHLDGNNGKTTLSLEELPSGIYFYTIRCGENVKTGKLVKRI